MQHTGQIEGNPDVSPDVSIIIPAKNEEKNIGKCLDTVFNQESPFTSEIIVIDSGSQDRTIEIIRQYPQIRLKQIKPEDFGHGKTRNLGARMSKGEIIVFLNADALPINKHWLSHLVHPLKENKKLAGVYSRHLPQKNCHLYMARDILKSMPDKPIEYHQEKLLDFMIFSTVSCAIPRIYWEKFPFDNEIIIAEDQQWARQIIKQGFGILYEPQSCVFHSHNYSPSQLYNIKKKIGSTEKKFKSKISAALLGLFLIVSGIIAKIFKDLIFILFKAGKWEKKSLPQKLREITIAFKARCAGFTGRYKGWIN